MRIYVGIILLFGLFSCSKWLEEDTRSSNVMQDYYKNQDALEGGLVGVYAAIPKIFDNSSLGLCVVGTDETYTTRLTSNTGPLDQYTFTPSTSVIENWYTDHYDIIQRANIIISRAPEVPDVSDADLKRILGEARFLRAWGYFRLVQAFGRVPLVLKETTEYSFHIKRDSIQQIYEAIIDDLTYASGENILPVTKNGGRVNHWAAKALLAKVYLTLATSMERSPQPIPEYDTLNFDPQELYNQVIELCDYIIANGGFSLLQKYQDVFLISNKNINQESIWEIQFSSEPGYGSQWSKQFGVYGTGSVNVHTINAMVGTTAYRPVPSFFRYFKLGDGRRSWSIADWYVSYSGNTITKKLISSNKLYDGRPINFETDDPEWLDASLRSEATGNQIGCSKYRWGNGADPDSWWLEGMTYDQANAPNNVIVLRYADVLLMRIEADIRLHDVASVESLEYMNEQLVARARGVNADTQKWYTETEMADLVMVPYEAAISEAQEALEQAGGYDPDGSLQAAIDAAIEAKSKAQERLLNDYTTNTLSIDEVMTQRACELCFEFHRWFDLVRTGTLVEKVSSRVCNLSQSPIPAITSDKHYLFPIPQREIDLALDANAFPQNPNY